jgi:chorismate mutase
MLEVHHHPADAWSDANQQLTPEQLKLTLENLSFRRLDGGDLQEIPGLEALRLEVDKLDGELLALMSRRLELSHALGHLKKHHELPILQPRRWEEILQTRSTVGQDLGLESSFLIKWLQLMHQESIRRQLDVYRPDSSKTP